MFTQLPFPELLPKSSWKPPDFFPSISQNKWISIDLETRDPHLTTKGPGFLRGDAYIAGLAIATEGFAAYYPVRHDQGTNLAPNVVFEWLKDEMKDFRGEVYGANLSYELEGLYTECGLLLHDDVKIRDVQIAEPIIDEETAEGYSLEVLSKKYLGIGKEEEILREAAGRYTGGYRDKKARKPISFDPKSDLWRLPPEFVGDYAEGDVDRPRRIYQDHQSRIIAAEGLESIFELESSLVKVLLLMRIKGVRVDLEKADKLRKLLTSEIDKFSMKIKQLVGFDPNVDSGKDMLRAYQNLHLRLPDLNILENIRKTPPSANYPEGQASFTADWYSAQSDPLSRVVQKKKKLMTLRDDFVVGDIINESIKGRIHCQFQQLRADESGTRSGRMSSRNPNLQQVPARHSGCDKDCRDDCTRHLWGKNDPIWAEVVRELFVPDPGEIYFKGDYSGQEPRLLVHFAGLCNLSGADFAVNAFRENPRTDYHQLTTTIVNSKTGKSYKRPQIKGINLGVMYGMGLDKLCRMLGLSEHEGKEILAAYHEALPFVKGLTSKTMAVANERGYIFTLLKRKRRFNLWERIPENFEERKFKVRPLPIEQAKEKWPGRRLQRAGIHKALNGLIQGSAADQTKAAMRSLYYDHHRIASLQVHDELNGSVSGLDEARLFKQVMETCVQLIIPAICDGKVGASWGQCAQSV